VINEYFKSYPESNKKFCDTCGAATIIACQRCNAHIPGAYIGGAFVLSHFLVPAFCPNCGAPYPWTESRLQAARELAQEVGDLTDDERETLAQNLDDIVVDTPRTTLAATRWKRVLARAGPVVADAFRQILVDVMSETAKKILWP
jgi:hypothetical protein